MPLHILESRYKGVMRWLELPIKTLGLLRRARPQTLFVQNPSLALSSLATLCRPFFSYLLVIDAHNEGVRPYDRQSAFVRWLTSRLLKMADVTIVTNEALASDVRDAGGRPVVLPDALPVPPALEATICRQGRPTDVVVVATYRRDEPIAALMAAARSMPDVSFAFSGDVAKFRKTTIDVPSNVRLTGFLPDSDYWQLLNDATVVCDLTLKSDCLVCGAYEALALGKAMLLSDNPATRDIFAPAAVFTGSNAEEIASALRSALDTRKVLEAGAQELNKTYDLKWQDDARKGMESIMLRAAKKRGPVR
ncbi:MAG TPA: hypothetical protein PKK10_07565 [Woeseiaceae bacterium]|nr:hypothetical protein [Woeseiaceae bacterium]